MDKKICPDCNGSGQWQRVGEIVANCPECNGTGKLPYVEPSPKDKCAKCGHLKHLGSCYHVSYIGGKPSGCGCFIEATPQPEPMPLIDCPFRLGTIQERNFRRGQEQQRDADMAWLPLHDQQVRKDFAEELCISLADKVVFCDFNDLVNVQAHLRAMAGGER
jgi:hypothetical protein